MDGRGPAPLTDDAAGTRQWSKEQGHEMGGGRAGGGAPGGFRYLRGAERRDAPAIDTLSGGNWAAALTRRAGRRRPRGQCTIGYLTMGALPRFRNLHDGWQYTAGGGGTHGLDRDGRREPLTTARNRPLPKTAGGPVPQQRLWSASADWVRTREHRPT